ncbi:MAG: AI-2 transport protein TqsA [Saprospiraceae bacterium]|jgi:predicted PurR-regulated permease PerM
MKNAANFCIVSITVILILIYGQNLLVPFILAMLLWFVMHSLKVKLNKVPFFNKYFPSWLQTLLSTGIIVSLLLILFNIISNNIQQIALALPTYESNLDTVIQNINQSFNVDILEIGKKQLGDFKFANLLGTVLNSISGMIGNSFMIILYALFILLEETNFPTKLKAIFHTDDTFQKYTQIIGEIEQSIGSYFKLKSFVSLITGVLSFIALLIIGVEAPAFWAFLIFILNFIPTIGSLVGTSFPATFALIQFGELQPFILVLVIVGIIQLIVGNVIEPKLMGSSMNISPLVTIIALSVWGALWGVVGMIISVPVTVIMIIAFSKFQKTKNIAILLSEKGKVEKSLII